ncbi:MAG: LapA family protein [Proteobacteria bacterium]|nr:LapA family protein [Pseudomonadota bacterium]MBU1594617.1 LapA family protein [Pseudomonadota bacterium]
MRYLKAFLTSLVFVLSMLFFVQNNVPLSTSIQLELNLIFKQFYSLPLPVYVLVLAAFLLGIVFSLGFLLVERIRLGLELKALRKQHAALEDEALSLRTLPLNQPENQSRVGL